MFKITPVTNDAERVEIAEALGIELREGSFLYSMRDVETSRLMGASQFEILDGYGMIYDLRCPFGDDDFEAMFILGRQTMNFIDICGITDQRAALDTAEERLLIAIGFKRSEEFFSVSSVGMFDGSHCSGH